MGVKKKVWRDPFYGNDRRRAQQYWAKRAEILGTGYMLPTAAESADWDARVIRAGRAAGEDLSMDAGRVRPPDKNASDLLVWGEGALLASEICEEEGKLVDAPKDKPKDEANDETILQALSLECRSDEFLNRYFRSLISE